MRLVLQLAIVATLIVARTATAAESFGGDRAFSFVALGALVYTIGDNEWVSYAVQLFS